MVKKVVSEQTKLVVSEKAGSVSSYSMPILEDVSQLGQSLRHKKTLVLESALVPFVGDSNVLPMVHDNLALVFLDKTAAVDEGFRPWEQVPCSYRRGYHSKTYCDP